MRYIYDGNGKRVKQVINGETIYSAYGQSGALLYRENATTTEKTDYVRVAGITVARIKAGVTSYLHGDHLGSPVAATTTGGAIQWREDYTPYGEERQDPAANDNDENFTGHIRDEDTGLIYAQARYMDPVPGRFLSADPVQFSENKPQMFNRYSYVSNNPINAIDPLGLAERTVDRWIQTTGSNFKEKVSITVEAGSLNQGQTIGALSGVSDSFFAANDQANLSSYAKPVSGGSKENRDTVGVQSQVAGRMVATRGDSQLQSAWGEISEFKITGRNHPSARAENKIGSGPVLLHNGFFGRSGASMVQTLIHEGLHDTSRWGKYSRARISCGRGRQIDCLAEEEYHNELDSEAFFFVNGD